MRLDHLVTQQLITHDVLTIMDVIHDKIIFVFNRINTSYHVNCWSEPEAEIKEMYVCTCTRVSPIKTCDILIVPLHLCQDDTNCHIDNNMLKP